MVIIPTCYKMKHKFSYECSIILSMIGQNCLLFATLYIHAYVVTLILKTNEGLLLQHSRESKMG